MMKYYSNVLYSEDRINLHYIATTMGTRTNCSVREAWLVCCHEWNTMPLSINRGVML